MTTVSSTPLAAGAVAPDFTVPSTSGQDVTLSAFRGQRAVLLAFFPLAFTSVCTSELCAFGDDFDAFTAAGVEVLPISVDATPSLKEFRSKYAMQVHLLSDFRRDVSRTFGVLREDTFFSQRAYFLIDTDGVIRWAHVEEHPGLKRENAEILAAVQSVIGG
jgi:peroxiredoxin